MILFKISESTAKALMLSCENFFLFIAPQKSTIKALMLRGENFFL